MDGKEIDFNRNQYLTYFIQIIRD